MTQTQPERDADEDGGVEHANDDWNDPEIAPGLTEAQRHRRLGMGAGAFFGGISIAWFVTGAWIFGDVSPMHYIWAVASVFIGLALLMRYHKPDADPEVEPGGVS